MIEDIAELFDVSGIITVNLVPTVRLQLNDVEPVLRAIQTYFQSGGVYPIEGTRTIFQWHVQRYSEVETILSSMLPHLHRQAEQARLALELTRLIIRDFDQPNASTDLLMRQRLAEQILANANV